MKVANFQVKFWGKKYSGLSICAKNFIFVIVTLDSGQMHSPGYRVTLILGEKPHFWCIFDVFCPFLKNDSNDFDEILRLDSPH